MKRLLLLIVLLPFTLFSQVPNTFSKQEKVFYLSKIWKEVEYNYAYFEKIGSKKWDSLYVESIIQVENTKNDYEYFRELQKFIASLQDGHTRVRRFNTINLWTTLFYDYLIEFDWIEEKVIIKRVNSEKKDEIPIGSELVEINGIKTIDYMREYVVPIIPASTDHVRMREAATFLFDGLQGMEYDVKLKTPSGRIISKKLTHNWDDKKAFPKDVYPPREKKVEPIVFKWFDNGIAYLAINTFNDISVINSFKNFLPQLYKAQKLIIDIRKNGGGNSEVGYEILSFFTNDCVLFRPISKSRLHLSHNKANGVKYSANDTSKADWIKEAYLNYHNQLYTNAEYTPYEISQKEKRIVIPTLVLTSSYTGSAAETFLVPIKKLDHIKTMGETTSGSTGTPYKFDLSDGAEVYICSLQSKYPDGTEFVGVGIKPDIPIKRTINGVSKQKDEILEAAIEYHYKN